MAMATEDTSIDQALRERLESIFTTTLDSITLYGSYVRGTWRRGSSDINVLILLTEPAPELIRQFGTSARGFLTRERITPLILTRREFITSADVFPMEYADIVDAHRTIAGTDPTGELDLQNHNLRHQLEHQLRGTLVALRQMNLASRGRRRALRRELLEWFGPLAAVFRGLIRLAGESKIPGETEEMIRTVGRLYDLDTTPFITLLKLRDDRGADTLELSDHLDRRLSELAQKVDFLRGDRGE